MTCITITNSGVEFNLTNIDSTQIDINDIAHHLSLINRFAGAMEVPYSVAQHSVIVSRIVHPRFALPALLHDAAEAYIGDISAPVKKLLLMHGVNHLAEYESVLLCLILEKYGVSHYLMRESANPVHTADMQVQATEFRDLFNPPHYLPSLPTPLDTTIRRIDPATAKRSFLIRFHELTEGRYDYDQDDEFYEEDEHFDEQI
ncbi:HD domain-containing protein [Gimesia algae]|uniref:HD domain-containing protein n=1 Tax=Gimesia algae TaxID=2527971 RepID=A0A517VME9_9PLAN|nr:hypothetical protein [Gimesia algae]QDT94188.1 hypothetical protein Pan161_58810 [Gimesia algae]